MRFSKKEIGELLKAYAGISLAFFLLLQHRFDPVVAAGIALLTVGLGFLVHELAHKFVAQYYHCYAEFKADNGMLILAVVLAGLFGFVFAAPGAVVVSNVKGKDEYGLIALAGPVSNIVLALLFLVLPLGVVSVYGFYINALLALFNMLPFGAFDGKKIKDWNPAVYWITTIVAFVLFMVAVA